MFHTSKYALLAKEDELFSEEFQDHHNNVVMEDDKDLDEEIKYWWQHAAQPQETESNYGQLPTECRPLRAKLDLYVSKRQGETK